MRDSLPSARYSPICNVLHQWKTSLIPIYRVYRLYDISYITILRWRIIYKLHYNMHNYCWAKKYCMSVVQMLCAVSLFEAEPNEHVRIWLLVVYFIFLQLYIIKTFPVNSTYHRTLFKCEGLIIANSEFFPQSHLKECNKRVSHVQTT